MIGSDNSLSAEATIALSCTFVLCFGTLVFSCTVCRKFFKKKGKDGKKNKIETPEIQLSDNGDCEKGIENPVYDANATQMTNGTVENETKKNELSEEDEKKNGNGIAAVQVEEEIPQPVEEVVQESIQQQEHQSPQQSGEQTADGEVVHEGSLHGKQMNAKEPSGEEQTNVGGVDNPALENNEEDEKPERQEDSDDSKSTSSVASSSSDNQDEFASYEGLMLQGGWRRTVILKELLEAGLVDIALVDEAIDELRERREELIRKKEQNAEIEDDVTIDPDEDDYVPVKLRPFICGEEPVAGIIVSESGEKKSIYRSAKEGLLRRGTAISMLEAQAATGNIIDPITGRKMSVKHAAQLGLLDKVYETVLTRAERAVTGYKTRASDDILSVYEAMQKGLVVESHGLRLLEAQFSTGGLIDHRINARLSGNIATQRGIINDELYKKLEEQDTAQSGTFFDPNTEESVTYKELMRRSVLDTDTGLRLYPLENTGRKRYSYGSYSGRSSLASSRSLSRTNSRESIPSLVSSTGS